MQIEIKIRQRLTQKFETNLESHSFSDAKNNSYLFFDFGHRSHMGKFRGRFVANSGGNCEFLRKKIPWEEDFKWGKI
jgi:hypothetical protein